MAENKQCCDLLMGAGMMLSMDDADTRIRDGGIAVTDGVIVAVDSLDTLREKYLPRKELMEPCGVLMPGLINAHTHETLTRGLSEDLPLMRWLTEVCYPIEHSYTREDIHASALMNQLELIRGGVTTSIDIFRYADAAIEVARMSGLRMTFTPQVFDDTAHIFENIDETVKLIEKYHDSEEGRIRVWFGPHAPYSCGFETYREMASLANELGVGIHTHISETQDEVSLIMDRYGQTPVSYLHDAGVLDVPCVLAHAIHITDEDIALLAQKSDTAGLVYVPISNMKLADGVCRVPDIIAAGCTVGLGTDSNLSSNSLDMFEEMRIGGYLQKLFNDDATIMPCNEMLKMATRGSAKVLHIDQYTGSLEVGKRADAILISFTKPHMWPVYWDEPSNVVEQIVYSGHASDVTATVVDGRVLMEEGMVKTLDEESAFDIIQRCAESLYSRSF